MSKEKVIEFYKECMNMDLSLMRDLIISTESEEEKGFYAELFNFVLKKRQKELIANGVY